MVCSTNQGGSSGTENHIYRHRKRIGSRNVEELMENLVVGYI